MLSKIKKMPATGTATYCGATVQFIKLEQINNMQIAFKTNAINAGKFWFLQISRRELQLTWLSIPFLICSGAFWELRCIGFWEFRVEGRTLEFGHDFLFFPFIFPLLGLVIVWRQWMRLFPWWRVQGARKKYADE